MSDTTLMTRAFDWLKTRAARDNEIAALSYGDLRYLAADLGVTEADLLDVVPRNTDNSGLMDKMMRARGLDPDAVRRSFSGLVRDMEVTCSRCRNAGTCQRELKAGTAAAHNHEFCGNAQAMDELIAGV